MTHQAPMSLRGNFVLLRADTLRLLLPQSQVGHAAYLDGRPRPTGKPGLMRLGQHEGERGGEGDGGGLRRFAALSADMTLLAECPANRFVVASLGEGNESNESLAWCWDELQVLIDVELHPRTLPSVLVAPHTPVEGYVEHAGELAYLCDGNRVAEFALASGVRTAGART